jgi:hypothetical protein
LRRSEAILATVLQVATPKEACRPLVARIRSRISSAMCRALPKRRVDPVTSRNASSSDSGSITGV